MSRRLYDWIVPAKALRWGILTRPARRTAAELSAELGIDVSTLCDPATTAEPVSGFEPLSESPKTGKSEPYDFEPGFERLMNIHDPNKNRPT